MLLQLFLHLLRILLVTAYSRITKDKGCVVRSHEQLSFFYHYFAVVLLYLSHYYSTCSLLISTMAANSILQFTILPYCIISYPCKNDTSVIHFSLSSFISLQSRCNFYGNVSNTSC